MVTGEGESNNVGMIGRGKEEIMCEMENEERAEKEGIEGEKEITQPQKERRRNRRGQVVHLWDNFAP